MLGEPLVALAAAEEMTPHCAAGAGNVGALDRRGDGAVLGLDALQIGSQFLAGLEPDPHALPRNEKMAEEFEETGEMRIFRRCGDRLVKRKIFVDRAFAATERRVDRRQRTGNAPARPDAGAFGGQACRLDLNAGAQLDHLHHLRDRTEPIRVDAERAALDVAHDERADALASLNQPFSAQHRDRLAHHGAAHPERRRHFLLSRQPRARRQAAVGDFRRQALDDLAGPVLGRTEREKEIGRKS